MNCIHPPKKHKSSRALPQRIRDLHARLATAIDDDAFPILAAHSGLDTKLQIRRMIRHEMAKLEVH